jgi:predicted transposase YdaD
MILTEWNTEDAIAFAREEGREEEREQTARNALVEELSFETIQKITGLDIETIKSL